MLSSLVTRIRTLFANTNNDSILLPGMGMCISYICHDALQERMFRFDGFTFGSFMMLAEVTIMILGALLLEGGLINKKNKHMHMKKKNSFLTTGEGETASTLLAPGEQQETTATSLSTSSTKAYYVPGGSTPITPNIMMTAAMIGVCIAISHGCGNTALRYSTYPLKVAFKSCKLLPTMWLGHVCLLHKRTFHRHQYGSAIIMCIGLVVLTLADSDSSHGDETQLHMLGPLLLAVSTSLDSIVPNLQERLFTTTPISTNEVMLLSNLWMFAVSLVYTTMTGELQAALSYCISEQQTIAVLLVQALCAYVGLRCYLTVIQHYGGVAAVLLANGRKIITISLSFLLWSKPFTNRHGMGLGLIFLGVYLGVLAKQRQRKNKAAAGKKEEDEINDVTATSKDSVV